MSALNRKWLDYLGPFGGTVLGLIVVPLAIEQYPEWFENGWMLPASFILVVICILLPLVLHKRANRFYVRVVGANHVLRYGAVIFSVLLLCAFATGVRWLFRFHTAHLAQKLAQVAQERSAPEKRSVAPDLDGNHLDFRSAAHKSMFSASSSQSETTRTKTKGGSDVPIDPEISVRARAIALSNRIGTWADMESKREGALASRDGAEERETEIERRFKSNFEQEIKALAAELKNCDANIEQLETPLQKLEWPYFGRIISALRSAAYDIPRGRPECGTGAPRSEGFSEKETGIYTVFLGGITLSFNREDLENKVINPLMSYGVSPFKIYVRGGKFFVDASVYSGAGEGVVEVKQNEFALKDSNWDRNFTDRAVEVVDQYGSPRFQMVFESPSKVRVNGVFPVEGNEVLILSPGRHIIEPAWPSTVPMRTPLKPIFKYPSWKYSGQYAEP